MILVLTKTTVGTLRWYQDNSIMIQFVLLALLFASWSYFESASAGMAGSSALQYLFRRVKPLFSVHSHPLVGSLFAVSLCLANPLWAKCPTYSVEIRGKVECFKADAKVLATLVFSDHQADASGEDTAIAVHDGTFSDRVAFDTLSSTGFFGGHKCHRHPKRVLIRLVGADGVEKDRTSLEIKSDFFYDPERGGFTPKSDVTMHGWCQPQTSSISSQHSWRKLDAGPFSILAPLGWEFHQLPGVDSYVGEFVGEGVALTFDFGYYARGCLGDTKQPVYVIAHESIGRYAAKIVSPRTPGHGITGVYFRDVGHATALCLWGKDLTSMQQELALKIFETIRFGGPPPRYLLPPPPAATQDLFWMPDLSCR